MSESSRGRFLSSQSTYCVAATRIGLIILSHALDLEKIFPEKWLYSDVLASIIVPPSQTLFQIREAQSIQTLLSGKFSDAYKSNQVFHLPPLMLAFMQKILRFRKPDLLMAFLLLLIDFMIAHMMEAVGRQLLLIRPTPCIEEEEHSQTQLPDAIKPQHDNIFPTTKKSNSLFPIDSLPLLAARIYFWSPITAMSGGIYGCFQNIPACLLVAALNEVVKPNSSYSLTAFLLAMAAYIEPHYSVMLVPLMLWQSKHQYHGSTANKVTMVASFVIWSASLQWLSYRLVGTNYWQVIESAYGCGWNRISPNLSVQWYLHIQLFSRFRDYFGTILIGLPFILVVPLTIRLHKYPIVLVALFSMIFTIFAPVQTLFDANLSICFFLFCPKSLARMDKIAFFALSCIPVPLFLNVADQWMWLETNTGNANFVFFQCLAYNVFLSIILAQFCSASLERDKALRIAAKEREASDNAQNVS